MGGGDLNLKRSWHPQALRNAEKVRKAERKKMEERAREETRRCAEDTGALRPFRGAGERSWLLPSRPGTPGRVQRALWPSAQRSKPAAEVDPFLPER
ncbi:pre-mRNA-splicing factor CWC25 homolog [Aptenodytes patagonicus]|uniref:pre-mRNA-splicing factor CWC25 homolog n=1 Tax=Aptenodytes patagonicus TaxID=9234 RepID=UPI003F9F9229